MTTTSQLLLLITWSPSPGLPLHATPWTAILPHLCSPCSRTLLPLSFPGSSLAECDEWDDISLVLCWPGLAAPAHLPSSVSLSKCVCLSKSLYPGWLKTHSIPLYCQMPKRWEYISAFIFLKSGKHTKLKDTRVTFLTTLINDIIF